MRAEWKEQLRLAAWLGIPPREFWRLSVAEWRALTGGGGAPMNRAALDALLQHYPDRKNG